MEITGIYLLAFMMPMLISLAQCQDLEAQQQLQQASASDVEYPVRNRTTNKVNRNR